MAENYSDPRFTWMFRVLAGWSSSLYMRASNLRSIVAITMKLIDICPLDMLSCHDNFSFSISVSPPLQYICAATQVIPISTIAMLTMVAP